MGNESMEKDPNTLIEFVGLPGTGKTTLAKYVVKLLREEGYLAVNVTTNHGIMIKHIFALLFIFRKPAYSFNTFFKLLKTRQKTLIDLRSVLTNWFYKSELFCRYSRRRGIYVFDEGPFHGIYSVLYSARGALSNKDMLDMMTMLPKPDLIFHIKAEPKSIIKRLLDRGGSRFAYDIRRCGSYKEQLKLVQKAIDIYSSLEGLMADESGKSILTSYINEDYAAASKNIAKQIVCACREVSSTVSFKMSQASNRDNAEK